MGGQRVGYARVSTRTQTVDPQIEKLKADGCEKVFTDVASGATQSRPQLDAMLDYVRSGDTVVIYRLDRLGRNSVHLFTLIDELAEAGVIVESLTESISTDGSATGKLTLHILGILAQFERDRLRERTQIGLDYARSQGRVGGRPKKLSDDQIAEITRWRTPDATGRPAKTFTQIAAIVGVSRHTVMRAVRDAA